MSFLDRISKGVGKAAEQAKFEADKLVRVNRLGAEVSQLATEAERATAAIGTKVMELRSAGGIQVPELDALIQRVEGLQAQVAAKRAELAQVQAEKFEVAAPPPPVVPAKEVTPPPPAAPWSSGSPNAQPAPAPAPASVCPACGSAVEPGAKFCPSCGQKLV